MLYISIAANKYGEVWTLDSGQWTVDSGHWTVIVAKLTVDKLARVWEKVSNGNKGVEGKEEEDEQKGVED